MEIKKPTVPRLDWVPSGSRDKISEPSGSKKAQGWSPNEPLPAQQENWILHSLSQWLRYFEALTDEKFVANGVYSGPVEPTDPRPFALWIDTSGINYMRSPVLKVRDSVGYNWVTIGPVDVPGFGCLKLSGGEMTGTLKLNTTDALSIPVGTVEQRPQKPVDGMIRYNSTNKHYEFYKEKEWDLINNKVFAKIADTSGQVFRDSKEEVIKFNDVVNDSVAGWSVNEKEYIVKFQGVYDFELIALFSTGYRDVSLSSTVCIVLNGDKKECIFDGDTALGCKDAYSATKKSSFRKFRLNLSPEDRVSLKATIYAAFRESEPYPGAVDEQDDIYAENLTLFITKIN